MTDVATALSKARAAEAEMNEVVVDSAVFVHEVWLAVLSQGHLLALGERGIAKTMAVDVFHSHMAPDIRRFYALCSKTMDPQLLVGNLSPKKLIEDDVLAYNIEGMLPDVEIGILDEVFKNNTAALNMLLGIINERRFVTGGSVHDCPLWSLIGTSNLDEYHVTGELAAFRDRFGSALLVEPVTNDDGFRKILEGQAERFAQGVRLPTALTILDRDDIACLQQATRAVTHPAAVMEAVVELRKNAESKSLMPSARRFGQLMQRMAAQAVLNGRSETQPQDLVLAQHSLWTDIEDKPVAYELVVDFAGQAVSAANSLRKTLDPVIQSLNEMAAELPADGSFSNEQYGALGRLNSECKVIAGKLEQQIQTATDNGEDTTDLLAVQRDLTAADKTIRGHLGFS